MDSTIQVLSGLYGMHGTDDELTLNGLNATEPAPLSSSGTIGGLSFGAAALLVGLGFWLLRPRSGSAHFSGLPRRSRKSRRRKSRR